MSNQPMPDADAFTTEVCWHYYINEMTQAEIAKLMGVTRLRVNQSIQRARALGMVRIEIDSPFVPRLDLQSQLQDRFGLNLALVAPAHPEHYDYHSAVGAALASYLSDRLRAGEWERVGVSWGMTLQCAIERMMPQSMPDLEVISMLGGTSHGESFNTFGIASGLAERLSARYSLLAAPIFLSPQVDKDAFLSQQIFAEHFDKLRRLDAAIMTASNISEHSYLIRTGLPANIDPATLIRDGAIGDTVGRFLDADGNVIQTALAACTVGIDLEDLRRVPERILAAAGHHKVQVIRAILMAKLANVLVTDDVTARLILAE